MLDREQTASLRRIVLRAVLPCAALVALAVATPRALSWYRHRAEAPPAAPAVGFDRPPTHEELAAARDAERELARARQAFGTNAIVPADAQPDAAGEKVRWFQGFGLSVQSAPPGAQVVVDGQDKGQTPLVTSVECTVGEPVAVEVRKPGRKPQRRTTVCRKDQLVELEIQLR